ncbi:Oxalate-binding protein [bioreactor metagenome]|uniref:Oxalate-binding protein n=1 Tax=bioreactor metagenome TaxID=1076179 RepID=A0A644XIJ7_9ZZZZ
MIRRSNERIVETHEHKFGGDGSITVRSLLNNPEELNGKGRVFAHTTLNAECGIGYHVHKGESETYYILSGEGEFNDNGTLRKISAGDVTHTPSGEGHGIRNTGREPLEFVALILYSE